MYGLGIVGYAIQTVRDDHHCNYLMTTNLQGEKVGKKEEWKKKKKKNPKPNFLKDGHFCH